MANLESVDGPDDTHSPESIVLARDESRLLKTVIDDLPPRCRQVFILRRVDELAMADIADRLHLSVSTVEKHLSKAIALVTRGMAGGALPAAEPMVPHGLPRRAKGGR